MDGRQVAEAIKHGVERISKKNNVRIFGVFDKNELDKYPKELGDLNDLVRAAYILKDASIKSIDQYFSNSKLDAYYL